MGEYLETDTKVFSSQQLCCHSKFIEIDLAVNLYLMTETNNLAEHTSKTCFLLVLMSKKISGTLQKFGMRVVLWQWHVDVCAKELLPEKKPLAIKAY